MTGIVVDAKDGQPIARATVTLTPSGRSVDIRSAMTDRRGEFVLQNVPFGQYQAQYGVIGSARQPTAPFTVDQRHPTVDLGRLPMADSAIRLDRVVVTARRDAFYNSIDRKVYNVGQDIQSLTGSASNLLQNIPSVDVDLDGNVSLRGNGNVLILINGQTTPLMTTANRAMVLEQMPADSIARVEVITNPSAKYRPDGTAGIINLVLKRRHDPGFSGLARVSGGNAGRYNAGLSANYNPDRCNLFATVSVRQDNRPREGTEIRSHLDPASGAFLSTEQRTVEESRPFSVLTQAGVDLRLNPANTVSLAASYNHLDFFRTATVSNVARAANGAVTSDYDRRRVDPEWHKTWGMDATFRHRFPDEGHEWSLKLRDDRHQELEDNHYSDVFRTPASAPTYDNTRIQPTETGREAAFAFVRPFGNGGKLEAGYSWEGNKNDMDFRGDFLDPATDRWTDDAAKTNRFIYQDYIHAGYVTYGRPSGNLGFLAGLRVEDTIVHTDQVTTGTADRTEYFRAYPSLHLSYNLTETSQLQLNYSHRIHRPESDDLNPFPEYQDPYNLREGNPHLQPEETHSIEAGFQYHRGETTYLATVYYRYTYHAFTTVTRYLDSTTLLTTHENLAASRAGGLELVANTDPAKTVSVNLSANAFYSEIDASNLGFTTPQSTVAWSAKLNADWHVGKRDLLQLNANFQARRLTAQGYRQPTFVANLGWRHELRDGRTALIATVSDVFNSLKERSIIDTPSLYDEITRRRAARIIYVGINYRFGQPAKQGKGESLPFDDQL